MSVKAVLIGSLGVLTDLTDLEAEALNEALAEAGLEWQASATLVGDVIGHPDGARRLADHAASRGQQIDGEAVLARQQALLLERLATARLTLRREIADVVEAVRAAGIAIGLVTTSPRAHVRAVLDGLGTVLPQNLFDVIIAREDVSRGKPHPVCYATALKRLGLDQSEAVAIEDSPSNARAARKARIATLAVPPRSHANRDFPAEVIVTDRPTTAILKISRAA